MNADQLLDEFAVKIYKPPLSDLRHTGEIGDLFNPICVAMLIIDFETEVSMNGINNFIGNTSGRFAHQTVDALNAIGCTTQAAQLKQILEIAAAVGMTHTAIQSDRSDLQPYAVTSFAQLHGDKWNVAIDQIRQIDSRIDYACIIDGTRTFIGRHLDCFRKALGH
jgi:hypothetical protein